MDIQGLLDRYGSPLYVYDLRSIREAFAALRASLPEPSKILYSLKANPHPAIVKELMHLGCWAEVSSVHELDTAMEQGCNAGRCYYTGPGKSIREISYAIARGVRNFSVDSWNEARKIRACAQEQNCTVNLILRVNPDFHIIGAQLNMTGVPSQFGSEPSEWKDVPDDLRRSPHISIVGFHIYVGTNFKKAETLLEVFKGALQQILDIGDLLSVPVSFINLGGGFGHAFAASGERIDFTPLRQALTDMFDTCVPGWRNGSVMIAFESGRYLVAESGCLFCTVEDVKASRGKHYVIIDSGIHHLGGMSGLGRIPRNTVEFERILAAASAGTANGEMMTCDIVGPLCTPLDCLTSNARMPELRPGDVLQVRNVGAYGLTASLIHFLSREAPAEVVVHGETVVHASRIQYSRERV